jgi:hypothetical protein
MFCPEWVRMKSTWLVTSLLCAALPTVAQEAAPRSLDGETLTAQLRPRVNFILGNKTCKLPKPLAVKGNAAGPLPGNVSITVQTLSQSGTDNSGQFNAIFDVNSSAGNLHIQNDRFEQAAPFDCNPQELPCPGCPHQRHFAFKFVTHYNATLSNSSHHRCGQATVSGQFGYSQSPEFKQSFVETLGADSPCHSNQKQ